MTFRKKVYTTLEELQVDLDAWLDDYNHERTRCCGRTPMATLAKWQTNLEGKVHRLNLT